MNYPNNPVGSTAPPIAPLGPQEVPATRGDIVAVVDNLDAILSVLKQIRDQHR